MASPSESTRVASKLPCQPCCFELLGRSGHETLAKIYPTKNAMGLGLVLARVCGKSRSSRLVVVA